ncbi:MAG: hypothetical protein HY859_07945 [Caulobacterales bacterium]|nr:hypothetical protein [Caulobacterales bacterium]
MITTGDIRCVSDCVVPSDLFFTAVWVWPVLGVALAVGWFAVRMRRN